MFSKFNLDSNKTKIMAGAALLALILCIVIAVSVLANRGAEKEVKTYDYNATEQALADEVKAYLAQYMDLQEQTSNDIADTAVQSYRTVMMSDADVINDEITDAVRKRVRNAIFVLVDHPDQLTDDTLDALASGVTEIIWQAVMSQLSENELIVSENDRKEEYDYLIQSLQEQIDDLNERKTKISINARIIDNTGEDFTDDAVLGAFRATMKNMSDEEILELAEKLGISETQLRRLMESYFDESIKELDDKLADEIDDLRRRFEREIASMSSKTGETGRTGAKGEKGEKGEEGAKGEKGETGAKGEKGENGVDGADGNDGKTTYIAYADDVTGKNFSLTPTETSRYVGTCITTEGTQPADYSRYSNWQEYRTYIITSTTDPDTGVTTVHIN